MNVLIVGGSGGIGAALVRALCQRPATTAVYATRFRGKSEFVHPRLQWRQLDITNEACIVECLRDLPALDMVINAAGLLHSESFGPEKTIARLDPQFFLHNMQLNVLPTLLLAKHTQHLLKDSPRSLFAAISARVGSIGENRLGGWYSYRCSKAALNMALKNLSIEWRRSVPRCVVAALHPGTTDTALSAPFQGNVPAARLFSPDQTASYLLDILGRLTPNDSGRFWSWDGSELPW